MFDVECTSTVESLDDKMGRISSIDTSLIMLKERGGSSCHPTSGVVVVLHLCSLSTSKL